MSGARLVMAAPDGHRDPAYLARVIRDHRVSLLHFVPSMLRAFLEEAGVEEACQSVREVISIGEALPGDVVADFGRRLGWANLHNLYGPAEASVTVTHWDCPKKPDGNVVPIGRPVANSRVHILDASFRPVPVGVPGEICLGGVAVGRGYLGRPDLTAERFVPDPATTEPGSRLYRTGDLGRYLAGGEIEFLGRIDHQVKLRGFRIELGEIESVLRRRPEVRDVAVIVREDTPGDQRLTAYIVPEAAAPPPVGASEPATTAPLAAEDVAAGLRLFLSGELPEYMIPAAWVCLGALPLNRSGKVDRKALPRPEGSGLKRTAIYCAPRSPAEITIAAIWSELLGREQIGIHDSFFELGGHSLLATRMISRLRSRLGVEAPVRLVFETPTVSGLAEIVEKLTAGAQVQENDAAGMAPATDIALGDRLADLSFAQERLWFIDRFEPGGATYNIPVAFRINGPLQEDVLERCLGEIVRRHETLRTTFTVIDGRPVQVIHPARRQRLRRRDVSALAEDKRSAVVRRELAKEARRPFDLASGPLLRATVYRLSERERVLALTMHHIVADGWSLGLMAQEFSLLYAAFTEGKISPLPELPLQYSDFTRWQRRWLQGPVLEGQLAYWKERLAGELPALNIPTDRPRPARRAFRGAFHSFRLPSDLMADLRDLSRRKESSLFMTLLAAFKILLARSTGQADIVVGTPIANRNRAEIEGLVGFFVNTLVLRTDLSGDPSFLELLRRVQDVTLGAYDHQDLSFELLVETLQPVRDLSRSPLFQVMFAMQPSGGGFTLPGLDVETLGLDTGTAKFDLSLVAADRGDVLDGHLEYDTDLFDAETAGRIIAQFTILLRGIVADPTRPVSDYPLLTPEERRRILSDWNDTTRAYPADRCIHELFEEQARKRPAATAVIFEDKTLTYGELDLRAGRVAAHLRRLGVGPETLVGVALERSMGLVVGLLGILKTGGAYVPLDLDYPADRLSFMLEDTQTTVLLAQAGLDDKLPSLGEAARVVLLNREGELEQVPSPIGATGDGGSAPPDPGERADAGAPPPDTGVLPGNLAYLIYTSGSTGRPKGVAVPHRAVVRLVKGADYAALGPDEVFLGLAPVSFDASTLEIWGPLLNGGALALMPPGIPSLEEIGSFIRTRRVTSAWLTVGLFNLMVDRHASDLRGLKQLLFGGDVASVQHVFKALDELPGCRLINGYGPTENTTFTACHEVRRSAKDGGGERSHSLPIGRPITNTTIYILDPRMVPVPVGVPGELYTGGAGLARGYHARPDLTAAGFVPDPFASAAGGRLYRTGDLVRYLPDGNIEFLGRLDQQVKIRGFRVEPGEIEAALHLHPDVRDAAVIVREDRPGDKRLVAYVVASEASTPEARDLRAFLEETLPDWMVPSALTLLPALPLGPTGKVDRAALPAPEFSAGARTPDTRPPRDELECRLVEIWEEVLGRKPVGIQDSFFESGGHSLAAVRMIDQVEKVMGSRLPVAAVFREPTIEHLAGILRDGRRGHTYSPLAGLRLHGPRPPIFCIHAAGGLVFYYSDLLRRLAPEQPVYGLQSRGLDGDETPFESLEDMASEYIRAIRTVQPSAPPASSAPSTRSGDGPRLVGYCMGGLIAFEMARQLRAEGREPGLVALIDTSVPPKGGKPPEAPGWVVFFWELVNRKLEPLSRLAELEAMAPGPRLAWLMQRARSANVLPPGVADLERFERWLQLYRANLRAYAAYQPRPQAGRLLLLRAAEGPKGAPEDLGWAEIAGADLQIVTVPGDHFSMLAEPNVAALAEEIERVLKGDRDPGNGVKEGNDHD
jgi:amino acid adenylation domain-containing protein